MKKNTLLIIMAFFIMIGFGFINNIRGVILPSIRGFFQVNYSQIGLMLFIASFSFLIATFVGGLAAQKYGQKKVLLFAFLTLIITMSLMPLINSFAIFVLLIFFMNLGLGSIEIGINSLGAKIFIKNTAVMMNLLHLFYGVGSIIGPAYAGWMLSIEFSWQFVYFYSIILIGIIFSFVIMSKFPENKPEDDYLKIPIKTMIKDKKIWLFSAVLGFAIVLEIGIANWLVNFLQKVRNLSEANSSFYLSFFFITFTAGRLIGGFIAEKVGYIKIIYYFTLASIIFFISALLIGPGASFLFSLVGFFVSIIYPTIMAIIMKEYQKNTSEAMGFIITASIFINMISNWLIGKSSDLFGLSWGFATIIIYASLLILCLLLLEKKLTNLTVDGSLFGNSKVKRK